MCSTGMFLPAAEAVTLISAAVSFWLQGINNHWPAYNLPIGWALIVTVIYSVETVDAFLINILAALFKPRVAAAFSA